MVQQTNQVLGTNDYGPAYSSESGNPTYASKFIAKTYYDGHPTTGAIGNSSKPILVTALSLTSATGSYDVRFQVGDTSPNGFNGAETATATDECYYGFKKLSDASGTVTWRRGDGINQNSIFRNGVSYNPSTDGAPWPNTSIYGKITWKHIPNEPTNFVYTSRTNSSVTLSWTAPSDDGGSNVNNYRVLYKVRNTATDTTASSWSVKVIGSTATTTTVTGLLSNNTYDFRVAAMNGVTDAHSGSSYTSASAIVGANAILNIVITENIAITGFLMPEGILTVPYVGYIAATGAVTYSVSAGSLPTGLSLNTSTGYVTGTPTVAGTYNFTLAVLSGGVIANSQAFTVIIYNSSPKVVTGAGPTHSRSILRVYDANNSGWQYAFMRVYDPTYTGSDGTHWKPIS